MHRKLRHVTQHLISSAIILFCMSSNAHAAIPDDSYIAGYAAGVLKINFNLELPSLDVSNGVITVPVNDLADEDQIGVLQLLSEIPGVTAIELLGAPNQPTTIVSSVPIESSKPTSTSVKRSVLFEVLVFPGRSPCKNGGPNGFDIVRPERSGRTEPDGTEHGQHPYSPVY